MINPTPGRVLWFYQSLMATQGQPQAAICTFVHNERSVNLAVFDECGDLKPHVRVRLVQEGDDLPETGHFATWMPYQIGQAKKHETPAPSVLDTLVQRITVLEDRLSTQKNIVDALTREVEGFYSDKAKLSTPPARGGAAVVQQVTK